MFDSLGPETERQSLRHQSISTRRSELPRNAYKCTNGDISMVPIQPLVPDESGRLRLSIRHTEPGNARVYRIDWRRGRDLSWLRSRHKVLARMIIEKSDLATNHGTVLPTNPCWNIQEPVQSGYAFWLYANHHRRCRDQISLSRLVRWQ